MQKPAERVRIGVGAGFADDRIEPAVALIERGELDYLVCECLAERTIARESLDKSKDPERGYTPLLAERMRAFLGPCLERNVRIVTNMGAANPVSGARLVRKTAKDLGLRDVRCAAVTGDDVTEIVRKHPELTIMENGEPLESILPRMASANAYIGADTVRDALLTDADVVLTGRVSDPSLFLGTMMYHLGWSYDDYAKLAVGTIAGHLLECSAQVTGGNFADPGKKDVERMAEIGFPFGDITRDGGLELGKTPGSGGRLDVMTCKEQLIYEIHDPSRYITPDCVLDVTDVEMADIGKDRVRITGMKANPRTPTFKVVVGYFDGYIGAGEVSYSGINAVGRAKLAGELVKERLRLRGYQFSEMRIDLIGMTSMHGEGPNRPEPYEVRLRVAARTESKEAANAVGFEVRALHIQGPTGGGAGINFPASQILAVKSVLIPREWVRTEIVTEGERAHASV